jgi:hypothetical protein
MSGINCEIDIVIPEHRWGRLELQMVTCAHPIVIFRFRIANRQVLPFHEGIWQHTSKSQHRIDVKTQSVVERVAPLDQVIVETIDVRRNFLCCDEVDPVYLDSRKLDVLRPAIIPQPDDILTRFDLKDIPALAGGIKGTEYTTASRRG